MNIPRVWLVAAFLLGAGEGQVLAAAAEDNTLEKLLLQELTEIPTAPAVPAKETAATASRDVASAVPSIPILPVLALSVVLGGTWLWLRKRPAPPGGPTIRKLAFCPLGSKRALAVVEVAGEKLLLGLGDRQLSLLARLQEKPGLEPASAPRPPAQEPIPRGLLEDHRLTEEETGRPIPAEKRELEQKFRDFWSQ